MISDLVARLVALTLLCMKYEYYLGGAVSINAYHNGINGGQFMPISATYTFYADN